MASLRSAPVPAFSLPQLERFAIRGASLARDEGAP